MSARRRRAAKTKPISAIMPTPSNASHGDAQLKPVLVAAGAVVVWVAAVLVCLTGAGMVAGVVAGVAAPGAGAGAGVTTGAAAAGAVVACVVVLRWVTVRVW